LELGEDAVAVGLTEERWDAGATGALPGGGTFGGVVALDGDAILGVAAFAEIAIIVDEAGRSRLAEESVADGARGALSVGGAFAIIDAAIAEA